MHIIRYLRWSQTEQKEGSTIQRQRTDIDRFAAARGWLSSEHTSEEFVADGVSSFSDSNLTKGKLGEVERRIKAGDYEGRETVIVVEQIDRLSRRSLRSTWNWIADDICASGVAVATANNGRIYTAENIDDFMGNLGGLAEMSNANTTIANMQRRVREGWRQKREEVKTGKIKLFTRACPGWLKWDEAKQEFGPVREGAYGLIQRIFDLHEEGHGRATIAGILNVENVPTFTCARTWEHSYVARILCNPAVTGELHFTNRARDKERMPTGEVQPGYYPSIISREQFDRVNDRRARIAASERKRGEAIPNVMASFARCGHCGGPMLRIARVDYVRKDGTRRKRTGLKCLRAKMKACTGTEFHLATVEAALVDHLLADALDDQHFSALDQVQEIRRKSAELRRSLELHRQSMSVMRTMIEKMAAKGLDIDSKLDEQVEQEAAAQAMERDIKQGEADIERLSGKVAPSEHITRVREVRAMADSDDRYSAIRLDQGSRPRWMIS
jgi:DNA invertase Pin-like site-specific DNA recombinase